MNTLRRERVQTLYDRYRLQNGFGIYSVNNMCVMHTNIIDKIHQEDVLMELYGVVHNSQIRQSVLEKQYLGRHCVSLHSRYRMDFKYGLPGHCANGLGDPLTKFLKNHTIRGYTTRLYWTEKEKNRKLWFPEDDPVYTSSSVISGPPLFVRSK